MTRSPRPPWLARATLVAIVSTLLASVAAAQEQPWSFVQAAGGLKIGKPLRRPHGWVVPVTADVSGLTSITTQPRKINPALVCRETKAQLEGQAIYITLVTGSAPAGGASRCPPVFIGNVMAGSYAVFYRAPGQAPVALGELVLAH